MMKKPNLKKLFTVSVLALLFLSMFAGLGVWQIKPVRATTLFSDGLESGTIFTTDEPAGAWAGKDGTGMSVVTSPTHTGTYSCKMNDLRHVYANFTAQNSLYYRWYFRTDMLPVSGETFGAGGIGMGEWTLDASASIKNDGGTVKWRLAFANSTGDAVYVLNATYAPTANVWHCLELWYASSTSNGAKLWVDENLVCTATQTTAWFTQDTVLITYGVDDYVSSSPTCHYDDAVADTSYIGPMEEEPPTGVSDPSEIRGVIVKWLDGGDTWETLADEYEPYGINWLVGESVTTYSCRSNLTAVNQTGLSYDYIGKGIEAAHSHGMNFTAMMLFGFRGWETELDPDICIVNQYGNLYRWTCPIKGHDLILSIVTEIATTYPNLDGFMFDYIRYSTDYDQSMCYCEQCHQRFLSDTGLTDTVWPTDVIPSGKYFMNFLEWRNKPIVELVRDVRATMLAVNPNLEFSIASLSLWYEGGVGYGHPIRQWFGQDTATMVSEGYIDVVCPMQYTDNLTLLEGTVNTNAKFMNGYYEGKVSFVPLIGGMEDTGSDMTPENLTKCINLTRALGADGYLIYRQIPNFAEEYLSQIPNNDTFTMSDIAHTEYVGDNMTVTWTTSAATSSVVQYSTSPLFYKQELTWGSGFKYYQVTNASFATASNSSAVTSHSLSMDFNATFNETIPIYFRVQSADDNNTLTSWEMSTMTTVVVTSPTNITYYSSTISVAFSAYGDTIDKLWYNCKNGTSWIYGLNETYTVPTSMTGFVNGTNYTFFGFGNNTEGDEGQATVTFSVAIPSNPSVTLTVTSPTNTTYTTPTVSVQLSASGGTIDMILWNCTYTNGTVAYANTVYTIATSMTLGNGSYIFNAWVNNTLGEWDEETVTFTVAISADTYTLTLTVTNPQNTTYTSSSIPVQLGTSGNDTNPVITYNAQFSNGTWVYGTNQTYSVITIMIINENATNIRFCCHVIGDNLAVDYKEVMFTVEITTTLPVALPITLPLPVPPVTVTWTLYMRSDTHTIDNQLGYILWTSQTFTYTNVVISKADPAGTAHWGWRFWIVYKDNSTQELTSGTAVAQVSRSSDGSGLQSATYTPDKTSFGLMHMTVALKANLYIWFGSDTPMLKATFISNNFLARAILNSTWTVYTYTYRDTYLGLTTARFYWGTTTYNSRIASFSIHQPYSWEAMYENLGNKDLVGFFLVPGLYYFGALFYGVGFALGGFMLYMRYKSFAPLLILLILLGGVGGALLKPLIPNVGFEWGWALVMLGVAGLFYKLVHGASHG